VSRVCQVCLHSKRIEIDGKLASHQGTLRALCAEYGVKPDALRRHRETHLAAYLVKAANEVQIADATSVIRELQLVATRSRKLSDACDRYLEDPEKPGEYYLGPRGEDVLVLLEWSTSDEKGKTVRHRRKELLHNLVQRIEESTGQTVTNTAWKHADPRKLIIEVADSYQNLVEVILKILAEQREQRKEDITNDPRFIAYQNAVASVLRKRPGALDELEEAMNPREPGAQRDLPMEDLGA
jgi:hypothetical protein